jgi:hypothetical protein
MCIRERWPPGAETSPPSPTLKRCDAVLFARAAFFVEFFSVFCFLLFQVEIKHFADSLSAALVLLKPDDQFPVPSHMIDLGLSF